MVAGAAYRAVIGGNFVREDSGYTLRMRLEEQAPPAAAASIIDMVGRRAASKTEEAVTFGKVLRAVRPGRRAGPGWQSARCGGGHGPWQ